MKLLTDNCNYPQAILSWSRFNVLQRRPAFFILGVNMLKIGNEKKMTVKEIADALNVSEQTIRHHIRNVFPEIVENGKATLLNEEQATAIKSLIGTGRNDLANVSQVKNVVTESDIERMTLQVIEYHQNRVKQLEAENAVMLPKAEAFDALISREHLINFRDAASRLGMTQSSFMDLLKSNYIYKNTRGEYRAYSDFAKYFDIRAYSSGTRTGEQLLLTIEGFEFFRALIK